MSRRSFNRVLKEIKPRQIFKKLEDISGHPETPVANRLMVFLKRLGMESNGASAHDQQNTFGIGKGSSDVFSRRVTTSILSLRDAHHAWPDAEERGELAKLGEIESDFPNCVGAEGTLFPLAFEPEATDAPGCSGRKCGFSITTMIICDHNKKIRYNLAGHPESCHDNRVHNNTGFARKPGDCFSPMESNMGDSVLLTVVVHKSQGSIAGTRPRSIQHKTG